MRNYNYDWEFFENGVTIVPISLGMVCDDGRELYVVNSSYYNLRREFPGYGTSPWIEENVMAHISPEDIEHYGVAHSEIRKEVLRFISNNGRIKSRNQVKLWGYYGAYDHVALAQLFGPMINLPQPIPMYTNEIMTLQPHDFAEKPERPVEWPEHHALYDAKYQQEIWKTWSKITKN